MFVMIGGVLAVVMDFREVMLTSPPKLAHCGGGGLKIKRDPGSQDPEYPTCFFFLIDVCLPPCVVELLPIPSPLNHAAAFGH